jgi:uncharacterized protein YdeI (YjbR/CyaY-like superfamily)
VEPRNVTHFDSAEALRTWLEAHHAERDELWVRYWKKATGIPSITWEESVDEALCFGWIDGIRIRVDEESYTIRFTPRRTGSRWSPRNVNRYGELQASGRIEPAGAVAFQRWTKDNSETGASERALCFALSDEFLARLRSNEAAWVDWKSRPPGYRKQVTNWVMSAKREATRERRRMP